MKRRTVIALAASSIAILKGQSMAETQAKTVAIIGTGRMGGAFGANFSSSGYKVVYGSRNPSDPKVQSVAAATPGATVMSQKDAASAAGILVMATPWAGTEVAIKTLGNLSGKLILDPTNAISFGKDGAGMAVETSGGEMLQGWAAGANVVKAFNTIGYFVIADPSVLDGKVACFLAGQSPEAKAQAAEIVTAMGFEAVDVGPIKNARTLEGMSVMYMVPYLSGKQDQRFEYAVLRSGNVKLGPVRTAG